MRARERVRRLSEPDAAQAAHPCRQHSPKRKEQMNCKHLLGCWIRSVDVPEVVSIIIAVWPHGIRCVDGNGIRSFEWDRKPGGMEVSRDSGKTWEQL